MKTLSSMNKYFRLFGQLELKLKELALYSLFSNFKLFLNINTLINTGKK